MSDLSGKAAVVTGGASGIGEALVALLTSRGAGVLAVDLDGERLDRVATATGCATITSDVSTAEANATIMDRAMSEFGRLDLAFLNAGVLDRPIAEHGTPYVLGDMDWDRYGLVRGVLLDAVIHGTVHAARVMANGGGIIATASAAGLVGWPNTPVYSAAKHGVVGWCRATAEPLERQDITINAICPGGIATPLVGRTADDAGGRLLSPAQVGEAMIDTALGGDTGQAISVVAGRDPVVQVQSFNPIPGFP